MEHYAWHMVTIELWIWMTASQPLRVNAQLALGMSAGHVPFHINLIPCEKILFPTLYTQKTQLI